MIPYTYKFRLYPNKKQEEYFAKCFGHTRFLWNKMLEDKENYYKTYKGNLYVKVTDYKKYSFLSEVDALALSNVKLNLNRAYKDYFNGIRGKPKFKSRKTSRDSYTTYNLISDKGRCSHSIRIENSYIRLPRIGLVKIRLHRQVEGKIKHVTVSKDKSGKYFISIFVETDKDFKSLVPKTTNEIGLDMGIRNLCTDSNGNKYDNPKFLKKSLNRLKFYQRSLSRKQKDSNNREKARIKVAKVYEKVKNCRRDYLHKVSKKMINENQVIHLETLSISSMYKNKHKDINRSIADTGLGIFIGMLKYKAGLYGREIKTVSKYYPSSQLCSSCRALHKGMKNLGNRLMVCNHCGTVLDRDVNAAINILKG